MPEPRTYTDEDCQSSTRWKITVSASVLLAFLAAVLITHATMGDQALDQPQPEHRTVQVH